jgi:hypothetical protein
MQRREWTKEWYEVLSKEQLSEMLESATQSYQYSTRWEHDAAATLMWSFRVKNLKEQIIQRESGKSGFKTA